MTPVGSHYATLGVRPDATAAEIRDAYRGLARRHHPDRAGADGVAMAAINEAYRVVGDPGRRRSYDAALAEPSVTVGPAATARGAAAAVSRTEALVDATPARVPWRLMLGMAVVGATVVLVGAALYEPAAPPRPDNLLEAGSCVAIEANGDAREVTCGDGERLVVEALVPTGERCPDGTSAHRDRQGRGVACVVSVP